MFTTELIALYIAVLGVIVASAALIWNIIRYKRNVKIRLRYGMELGSSTKPDILCIDVINNGYRPINIREHGFFLADKSKLINPNALHNLGWVKDNDGITIEVPKQEIEEMVKHARKKNHRIVAAYVRDSTHKHYRAKISKRSDWFN